MNYFLYLQVDLCFFAHLIFTKFVVKLLRPVSNATRPSKNWRYALFRDHLFHVIEVTKLEADTVQTWKHCLLRCIKNEQCFSTNTGVFPRPNRNFTCELLPTEKSNASKKFKADHTFHHYCIVVSGTSSTVCNCQWWMLFWFCTLWSGYAGAFTRVHGDSVLLV